MSGTKKQELYGNYRVYSPDDILMFKTSKKKYDWYLRRGLAEEFEERAIRLNFTPAGYGDATPYTRQDHVAQCVVCGTDEELTKHHVVPTCFRKHLPPWYKDHNMHDVVVICVDDHTAYEEHATMIKHRLLEEHDLTQGKSLVGCSKVPDPMREAYKIASALTHNYDKIPEDRRAAKLQRLEEIIGHETSTEEILELSTSYVSRFQPDFAAVVANVDVEEFVRMWRQDFIDTMEPQFMPLHWDIEYKLNDQTQPDTLES